MPAEVPLKPQCPSHPRECGPILLCPPKLSSGWAAVPMWAGMAGLCRAVWPLCWVWVVSQRPAGPVPSSVCPAAVLLVLSPRSHLLMTFPLSPLVIISPEMPQPGLSSLFSLALCIFREKILNVKCCSQTAALVTSTPVGL